MRKGLLAVLLSTCVWFPAALFAQPLDTPGNGSFVSGIGYVRGWKCTAGTLTFTIDDGPPAALSYGGERGDTLGVCGDTTNGFITQYNWNLLSTGHHTLRVFDNGQQFAQSTFTVTTLGSEVLTGQSATCTTSLAGKEVTLTWQQDQQNFAITGASGGGGGGSICTTKGGSIITLGGTATFSVTNPCTGNTLTISFTPTTSEGYYVCGSFDFVQNGTQFNNFNFEVRDATSGTLVCGHFPQGVTKNAVLTLDAGVALDFTEPFSVYVDDQKLADFP
jgi:hypothetical protein